MHRHLVTVKVSVERGAHERVQLNRLALHELWLKGLDTETVQRRRAVEQHRTLTNDHFQEIPHIGAEPFHHPLGRLNVLSVNEIDKPLDNERLKEFLRYLLRQATLVQFELRTDNDDRTA